MSIGYHVERKGDFAKLSLAERVIEAYDEMHESGLSPCVQIFACNPRSGGPVVKDEDIATLAKWPHHAKIVIHGSYLSTPWKLNPRSIGVLRKELQICDEIGAAGVVAHLPASLESGNNICKALEMVAGKNPPESTLWLEIKAAKSRAGTYETPEKIKDLFDEIKDCKRRPHVGLCVDTQHLFACGVSFRDYEGAMDWLEETRRLLPKEFPIMIHLNDSKSALGSGVDAHENLGHGQIWHGYGLRANQRDPSDSGIMAVLVWAELNDALVVLETPDPAEDLKIVRGLSVLSA